MELMLTTPVTVNCGQRAVRMIKNRIMKMKEWVVCWLGEVRKFLKPFFRSKYLISLILRMVKGKGHRPVVKDSSV